MSKLPLFYAVSAAFFVGIASSFLGGVLLIFALSVLVFLSVWLICSRKMIALLAVLFLLVGFFRSSVALHSADDMKREVSPHAKSELVGVIVSDADVRENTVRYVVAASRVDGHEWKGRVMLKAPHYPRLHYGDEVELTGQLMSPKNNDSGGTRVFNYEMYLKKDGISYEMYLPKARTLAHGRGNPLVDMLLGLKASFIRNLHSAIAEPESLLAGGLVIGDTQSLGKEKEAVFRRAGVIHIVVLSGFNITIVADALMRTLSFLPAIIGATCGSVAIVFFAIMTGASATVVRSVVMALLAIFAKLVRRRYDPMRALFVAAVLMVFQNPFILLYDPSFQLSFLATFGLMAVSPHVEPRLFFVTEKMGLRGILSSTIATQLFVMPYLLYQIGDLSLAGFVTNLLILPLIPLTMLASFLAGIAGYASSSLAFVIGIFAYAMLHYELAVIDFFGNLAISSIHIEYFPLWLMSLCYALYAFVLWRLMR